LPLTSPIEPILRARGVVVLDGGLATELERRGHNLDHPLWSARVLQSQPETIRDIHLSYLEAGADCLITSSYQASLPGLTAEGLTALEAKAVLERSVNLAVDARSEFLDGRNDESAASRPLVAASIGPYGAYLSDGSEYRGDYGVSRGDLRKFHEARWAILSESGADLLACETIPSFTEAQVLLELLQERPGTFAWVSFSCRNDETICDGTPIAECAQLLGESEQIVAIGVNCTAPRHIGSLIQHIRIAAPNRPVGVYPNAGQIYDAGSRSWTGVAEPVDFGDLAVEWARQGAQLIGGCCGTGPEHIAAVRAALVF